jgi:hypothetical protein
MASALFNSFKASTTAISSRPFARTIPTRFTATSHFSRRHYSEEKSANGTPEQEMEEKKKEADAKPDDKISGLTEKLKAKEAEVVDLTVSCTDTHTPSYFILTFRIGKTTVSSSRLCQSATEFCTREGADTRLCNN